MTTYRAEGFAFNRDNIKGIGSDMLGGLNRFLAARERELNTFELETLTCSGGPLDGQTIELTAPHADAVDCQASYAELMRTAVFTLRGMTGHYQKHKQKEGRAAVWVPEGGALPEKAVMHPKAKQTSKTAAPAKLGRGFAELTKFLAKMAEEPQTVEHAGQVFALFKIGRTQYRIKNTPEAIEKLRAAVLKKKKWFSDKLIDAPREPMQADDATHARAAQDVARVIAQATHAAQQETPAEALHAIPEPLQELATACADLETAHATQDQPHQHHGARIAQTLRENCDKTTAARTAGATLYNNKSQRIQATGDAMQHRAGHGRIAQAYHAAAGMLHSLAGQLRAVDNSAPDGAAGGGRWINPATTGSTAVPKMQTTPTPARPRDQAPANYTPPRETLHTRDCGGQGWHAVLTDGAACGYRLAFWGADDAPEPLSTHPTRRARAQALRAMVRLNADQMAGHEEDADKDYPPPYPAGVAPLDKPEPAHAAATSAVGDYSQGRGYQPTQAAGLHATPRDLGRGAIMPAMTYPEHMTGAELQTLREGCGLDRDEFAGLADVQARTVKHWENGRAGVPADVAQLARELDAACTQGAAAMLQRVQFEDVGAPEGQPVVLVRYKTPQDMPQGQNMPAGLQGAMVARVRLELLRLGRAVRVVWFDANQGDALAQLQAQTLPHRGDQPAAH